VTSGPFENFILLLIILNTLLLMLKFEGAPIFFIDILRQASQSMDYNLLLFIVKNRVEAMIAFFGETKFASCCGN
jgi:hypothetical protein